MANRRIVIVGGGFGGVYCAKSLSRHLQNDVDWEIVLLSNDTYFLFYPLLIKVATGEIEPRHSSIYLRSYLKNVKIVLGQFSNFNETRQILNYQPRLQNQLKSMAYDHLVLALGSRTMIPEIPGLNSVVRTMHALEDALATRRLVMERLEKAESIHDEEEKRNLLTFVIVGGGYTGCELAGEIHEYLLLAQVVFPNVKPQDFAVHLIEQQDSLLPGMPKKLGEATLLRLRRRGINVHIRETLEAVYDNAVELKSGKKIFSNIIYWCAGVGATKTTQRIDLPKNQKGLIKTTEFLNVPGYDNIWAIGDCAANPQPDQEKNYPATAQVAYKMAGHLAANILRRIHGRELMECYIKTKGMIVPLGGHYAVTQIGKLSMKGFLPWLIWGFFYSLQIPGFANKTKVGMDLFLNEIFGRDLSDLDVTLTNKVLEEIVAA